LISTSGTVPYTENIKRAMQKYGLRFSDGKGL
jgi:hypothetical protein